MDDDLELTDEMRARRQEIFDAVWRGAERQGWQTSRNIYGCINVDAGGRMCAVALAARHLGCSLDQLKDCSNVALGLAVEHYISVGERVADVGRFEYYVVGGGFLIGFAERLRDAHDSDVHFWRDRMAKLGRDLGLRIPEGTEG